MRSEKGDGNGGEKVVNIKPESKTDGPKKVKSPPVGNYWRILSFGTKVEHAFIFLAFACAAGSGVALPLMNIVFGHLVGDFNNYFVPGSGVTEQRFKAAVSQNALYIVYLFIGKFVLTYVAMFCFRVTGLRISAALRLSYMRSLFAQPVKKLDEVSAGTVANTVTTAANTIQLSISDRLSTLFQSLALCIAAFAIAFSYSWALTLVTGSAILFIIIFYSFSTPFTLKAQQNVDKADEQHATVAAEVVSSIRTVFSLGAEEKLGEKHSNWVNESHKNGMKLVPLVAIQLAPIFFAIYACYSLAFWFGLKLYREGHISDVSTVIIVFFSVLIVTGVMGGIVHPLMNVMKAISASTNFFEMIDSDRIDPSGLREPQVSAHGDLVLQDVNFAYPTRSEVQVIKNFTATFQKGKTTALVGPSGSGKSTIVGLLERWYELQDTNPMTSNPGSEIANNEASSSDATPEKQFDASVCNGSILTDGHNINDFDLKWWRSQIGLVQQEPVLFNDTIERNVGYGLVGTKWEHADESTRLELIKDACRQAFADDFISKLPKGYSTFVGEGGIQLSGGQRQRIAIARSIIRQPAILILDEATSSIDVQGERIVQKALDQVSKNRTTIMIAHRLSTIRKADQIVVLRNGEKIEEGTHESLLSNPDGLYSSLVQAQMIVEADGSEGSATATDTEEGTEPIISHQLSRTSQRRASQSSGGLDQKDPSKESGSLEISYTRKGFFRTVGVFLYEQKPRWPFFLLLILAAMGAGAAYALQSWFFAQLIVTFTYVGQRLVDAGNHWALMFFILALAVAACYGVLGASSTVISTHSATDCRKEYFKNTLQMPIEYFDKQENASGTVMSRLSTDPKQLLELLGLNSAFPLISIFNLVGSVIISFYFGWKLTLVTFFAVMPVVLMASFVRVRYEVQFEVLNSKVFASSSQFATEAIGAFRTVSSLTMEDSIINKYESLLQEQIKNATRKATYAMLIYAFTESIELCGMALTFWYGGQLLASREYNPLQFFVIYAAIVQGAQAAGQYLSISPNIAQSTAAANRMLEVRSSASKQKRTTLRAQSSSDSKLGAKVEFQDVSFSYKSQTTPLYSHLNLVVEAGQFAAFVGPSGCGKTTTISLLEQFYEPSAGRIALDGQDISAVDILSYRRDLSLVAQEPRLFSGTIMQNLLLGVDESKVTEEEITQACKDAEIHDFIVSLPDGYGTELGLNTQTALSGGQKQRLCLARALLRKPKLLLLDEATSSLDSQSERLVQSAVERIAAQKSMTVISVAHRLATIQKAEVIFVFGERDVNRTQGTRIIEKGTHSELLARRGVYWSMCQAQALDK